MRDRRSLHAATLVLTLAALSWAGSACAPTVTPAPIATPAFATGRAATLPATQPAASPVLAASATAAPTATAAPSPTAPPTATALPPAPTQAPTATPTPPTVTVAPALPAFSEWRWQHVDDVAWSPQGDTLAVAGTAGLSLVRVGDPQPLRTLAMGVGMRAVAWAPTGQWLAAGTYSNTVPFWGLEQGQVVRTLAGPDQPVAEAAYFPAGATISDVAVSPDGGVVAAAVSGYYSGGLGSVWRWQAATGEALGRLTTYGSAQRLAYSPDGSTLALATLAQTCARRGGGIVLWQGNGGQAPRVLSAEGNSVLRLAFQPGGNLVAGVGWSGDPCPGALVVRLWDGTSGAEQRELAGRAGITGVSFSADGLLLAGGDEEGTLYLWDPADGHLLRSWPGHGAAIVDLAFSPQGRALASWSADGVVRVWEGL